MNNIKDILISELTQARSYIERLLHAATEVTEAKGHPKLREVSTELTEELESFIRTNIFNSTMQKNQLIHRLNIKDSKANFKILANFFESYIWLGENSNELIIKTCMFTNLTYKYAQQIHIIVSENLGLDVHPPRLGLLKEVDNHKPTVKIKEQREPRQFGNFTLLDGGEEIDEELEDEIIENSLKPLLYQLDIEEVMGTTNNRDNSLLGLESKRVEKYEKYLGQGHKKAFQKKFDEALEAFEKAMSYKETAEIVTLIGWAENILGNKERAKSLCIQAIGLDPDYGPPYNDLGSILLAEGQVEEAIKWFELAKKAAKYQNKEYPYINAGRAFMMLNKYENALVEFETAIDLCPHNIELIDTVDKIKESIAKSKRKSKLSDISSHLKVNFSKDQDQHPEN